jgi:hypothetical protein
MIMDTLVLVSCKTPKLIILFISGLYTACQTKINLIQGKLSALFPFSLAPLALITNLFRYRIHLYGLE